MSPLSSSLLADWLDISGNISQAELELMERDLQMTSPMAMSYTEFSSNTAGGASNSNMENQH